MFDFLEMASPLPSTSKDRPGATSQSSSQSRRFLKAADVLAEIFHDSVTVVDHQMTVTVTQFRLLTIHLKGK